MHFTLALLIFSMVAFIEASEQPHDWCSGQYLKNVLGRCGSTYGATEVDISDIVYINPAQNDNIKCYRACVFNACQAYNPDGSFAAHVPNTQAFALTRRNTKHWRLYREVSEFCIKASPAITYEHPLKSYTLCDKTEDFLLCLRANLPAGTSFEGLF